ncbi:SDR family NAD(P)-dependent oxidoreductase [Pseudonocardia humida]|uniref:SDR family oxidoreductase n=1 Tax=Pseudonocardia humida TaxID=2800819 RepID=A0ABT1A796_9PSEU|nr:SDR family oxidoreductase [Pseudonocardia humida]MCO1658885.1 SDR family oxidoreductase [Pseudonocardia humida]
MPAVLVLGAGRPGIGQAVTKRFLEDGFEVYGTIDNEYAKEVEQFSFGETDSRLKLKQLDHSDLTVVTSYINELPEELSGIVVAEFYFAMEDPDDFKLDVWNKSLAINLTLPKVVYHSARSKVINGGFLTIVTSTEGFIGSFGAHAYAATKAGVHNLVKSIANIASGSIRANAVAAGWIGGVMDTDEVFNMSRRITPLARLGDAAEVAGVVAFLASRDAQFVNGSTIVADGGYSGVDTIAKFEFQSEYPGK